MSLTPSETSCMWWGCRKLLHLAKSKRFTKTQQPGTHLQPPTLDLAPWWSQSRLDKVLRCSPFQMWIVPSRSGESPCLNTFGEGRMECEIYRRIGAVAAIMWLWVYWSVLLKKELSWKTKLLIYLSIYMFLPTPHNVMDTVGQNEFPQYGGAPLTIGWGALAPGMSSG